MISTKRTRLDTFTPKTPTASTVPNAAWKDLSVDFTKGPPKAGGKKVIIVVVDKFTKYSQFIPLSHPLTAAQVA